MTAYCAETLIVLGVIITIMLYGLPVHASPSARPAGYPGAYCAVQTSGATVSVDTLPAWTGGNYPSNAVTTGRKSSGSTFTVPAGHSDCYFDTNNEACTVVCIPSAAEKAAAEQAAAEKAAAEKAAAEKAAAEQAAAVKAVAEQAAAVKAVAEKAATVKATALNEAIAAVMSAATRANEAQTAAEARQAANEAQAAMNEVMRLAGPQVGPLVATQTGAQAAAVAAEQAAAEKEVAEQAAAEKAAAEKAAAEKAAAEKAAAEKAAAEKAAAEKAAEKAAAVREAKNKTNAAIAGVNANVNTIKTRAANIANNTSYCSSTPNSYYMETLTMVSRTRSMAADAVKYANDTSDSLFKTLAENAVNKANEAANVLSEAWTACNKKKQQEELKKLFGGC